MRIGYIVPSLDDTTGWGRWVNDFLNHITAEGVEPVLWAPRSSEPHRRQGAHPLTARFVLPELFDSLRSSAGVRSIAGIRPFLGTRRLPPGLDLVHSLDAYPWCFYGHLLARAHGVPHVITSHGRYGYLPYRRLIDRLPYAAVLRATARVIAVSDAVRREILRHFAAALPASRATVLLNAVDADRVAVEEPSASAANVDQPPLILSVTRFIRSKGILPAVEAFARVRERIPAAQYVIVGPGNSARNGYYREVEAVIRERGIEGITIAGRLGKAELARCYRRASLLLHTPITLPDDFEAYGLILLEAGVFGLPVVASDSGGHREVIEHGVAGLLVPENDPAATADAVVELLRDPARAHAMGGRNREVALARNWRWYSSEQTRLYQEILAAPEGWSPEG